MKLTDNLNLVKSTFIACYFPVFSYKISISWEIGGEKMSDLLMLLGIISISFALGWLGNDVAKLIKDLIKQKTR